MNVRLERSRRAAHAHGAVQSLAVAALLLGVAAPLHAITCNANIAPTTPDAELIVNGDGTVTHTRTGLMWKQCTEGQSGALCSTGVSTIMNFAQAQTAAANSTFAGHHDWRLPNYKELQSIVEASCADPSLNIARFLNPENSTYWSNTEYPLQPMLVWTTYFPLGSTALVVKTGSGYVRLVRSGRAFNDFDLDVVFADGFE